jgi:ribonucleoside-diphosphate reductase alpha chain
VANRSIAPTGTIGMLASTTTGIEPVFAVAYKRKFFDKNNKRKFQYHVESVAKDMIDVYGVKPEDIESASDLAKDPERRIQFQADVQDYVDMAISSTINLTAWDGDTSRVKPFAGILAKYADRLRGFTVYPDGSRGGQPLTVVPYEEAVGKLGQNFDEALETNDVCSITGGGYCGL